MVAPVYEYGARSREVYFPVSCGWYDFYSGKYVNGGQKLTVDAPYERIPLYVCEGAIVPYGPDMQYSDENRLRKSLPWTNRLPAVSDKPEISSGEVCLFSG